MDRGFESEEDDLYELSVRPKTAGDAHDMDQTAAEIVLHDQRVRRYILRPKTATAWVVCIVFWLALLAGIAAFCWWIIPLMLRHIVVPIQKTVQEKWNHTAVAFLVIAGITLVPIVLIPAGPFIWLSAVSLGVWKGYLVVQAGTAIGMTVSYWLGRRFLRARIKRRVEKKDWAQALFIAVKEAGPFKVVLLMRLGPAPYALLNYACSLSPDIRFWPYLGASVIGRSLHNLIDIYIGSGVNTAGEAASGEEIDPWLVVFYAVGFVLAVGLSLWGYLYAKRALNDLRARAEAREQVLTAFTFPELELELADASEDEFWGTPRLDAESHEHESLFERRHSSRSRKHDLESRPERKSVDLDGSEFGQNSNNVETDSEAQTSYERSDELPREQSHKSGSLKATNGVNEGTEMHLIADCSRGNEESNEDEDLSLMHDQTRSS